MNPDKLYTFIDDDDEMSDKEKRDAYRSEMADQSDYEEWMDNGGRS